MEGKGEKPSVCESERKNYCSAPPTRPAYVTNKIDDVIISHVRLTHRVPCCRVDPTPEAIQWKRNGREVHLHPSR